jgi:hypothetical protein
MWERVLDWIWDLHGMNCREAVRLSSHALERRLTLSERFALWCHHRLCRWCLAYSRQIRAMRRWMRTMRETAPGPRLAKERAARIKAALAAARKESPPPRDEGESA